MGAVVVNNEDAQRYELRDDGDLQGFASYKLAGDRLAVLHVEIFHAYENKGLGRLLVEDVFEDARRRGLAVIPACPFARVVIQRNPSAYLDLVPAELRADLGLSE